jgi:outer membrane lipoprotein-sorting protein
MHLRKKLVFAASMALLLLASRTAFATSAEEKDKVLRQLDVAAKKFTSAQADFQFDTYQTDPIPDHEWQRGTVYYERVGRSVRMAAHIHENNGKPAEKVYTFSKGVFQLFEGGNQNKVTTLSQFSKYESYLMLGFGAGGKELEEKWEITYLGSETLLDGAARVKTEKLELVAKDPAVRKNLPKVTIWVDTGSGVNLKQVFDEGSGQSRVCVYFNAKVNQPLKASVFTFAPDRPTPRAGH